MKGNIGMAMESPKKGKGKIRSIRIRKAANGHTMSVEREGEYDNQPRVYAAGQHPQMFADAHKALGLSAPPIKKKAGAPKGMAGIGAQMLWEGK